MHSKAAQDTSMNKALDFSLFGYKCIGKYRSMLLCVFEYYYPAHPLQGFEPTNRPARSKSLYQLRHRGP